MDVQDIVFRRCIGRGSLQAMEKMCASRRTEDSAWEKADRQRVKAYYQA